MTKFSTITIIFNPNSTGPGKKLAQKLKADVHSAAPNQDIHMIATKYAGHAEKLAYKLALSSPRPLIISASGDGGYHEVINGLVQAQQEGAKPTAGLLPAGNANDHFKDVYNADLAKSIVHHKVQQIDLLKLTSSVDGKSFTRYAHSYIGLGLTPTVGKELNKVDLNKFNEIGIVLKTLIRSQPLKLEVSGKQKKYDSLVFSNIRKMSKVLTLSKKAAKDDGKFEVTSIESKSKVRLLKTLIGATIKLVPEPSRTNRFTFKTLGPTLVQLDGEIYTLDANSKTVVSIEEKMLSCLA